MAEKRLARTRAVYRTERPRLHWSMLDDARIVGVFDREPPAVYITDNGFTANVIEGELHDPGDEPTT